jgi:hypothetical protein
MQIFNKLTGDREARKSVGSVWNKRRSPPTGWGNYVSQNYCGTKEEAFVIRFTTATNNAIA